MSAARKQLIDRHTEIGALSDNVRAAIKRAILPVSVLLVGESFYLLFSGRPGGAAFALICCGCLVQLSVWSTRAIGLPLLPLISVQTLIIYGLPIATGHEIILTYPPDFVLSAGKEVLIFDIAMLFAWYFGMQLFSPSPPVSYALQEFNKEGIKGWTRLGFSLVLMSTGFMILQSFNLTGPLISMLPNGTNSIFIALVSVVSACGFFLISMAIGGRATSALGLVCFWALLVINGMFLAEEFLLYSAAANLITVAIGFFWGSGRVPWKYILASMLCLSFLNTGKTTMRARYWGRDGEPVADPQFNQLPAVYSEWIGASYDAILENHSDKASNDIAGISQANKNQTLLDRIDNLQNLLFVIDAVEVRHISPLHGTTYTLIPPLLVPRVFAPNKPRSHEGQVLLNVHFGRQDLNSTFDTYIAWGLLPEAYGNFGPVAGAILVGGFMGLTFAWIENLTVRKLVLSLEGFMSLSLLMSLMNSFEMVASVLVTSLYQSLIIVAVASAPFVRRQVVKKVKPKETETPA